MVKTPSEKWKETVSKLRKNCQKILQTSDKIRYVGVINPYGRTLTGALRPGLKPLLQPGSIQNEFFLISNLLQMRNYSTSELGKLNYVLFKHDKVNIILIQKGKRVYYVTINAKEKNLDGLLSKIKKAI